MRTIKPKALFTKAEEKRNHIIMWIVAVVFILLAYATHGQNKMKIERVIDTDHGKSYTCKVPDYSLAFNFSNTKDTISLFIMADSLFENVYSILLYSYYTAGITPPDKGIKLWFADGTYQEFEPYYVNKITRKIKYEIIGHSFEKIHKTEIHSVEFKEVALCEDIRKKRYFMEFLDLYDK